MATVYLDQTLGDDARTYTQAQVSTTPWKTWAKVNTSATDGDTVEVANGTYDLAAITWTKHFTWNGASRGGVILTNGAARTWSMPAGTDTFNKITWDNSGADVSFNRTTSLGVYNTYFNDCIFRNIDISPNRLFQSGNNDGATHMEWNRCLFEDIKGAEYILMPATNVAVDSYFFTNTNFVWRSGITPCSGIIFNFGSGLVVFKNVIAYNATGSTIRMKQSVTTGMTVSYSDTFNMTGVPAGTQNITSDPLFVDVINSNYNLRPTSPCINTGTLV